MYSLKRYLQMEGQAKHVVCFIWFNYMTFLIFDDEFDRLIDNHNQHFAMKVKV